MDDDGSVELKGHPYDVNSIMHYPVHDFAKTDKNGKVLDTRRMADAL
jgi:hypothetical protein